MRRPPLEGLTLQIITEAIDWLNTILYSYLLIYLLAGAGLYFTIRTRFVQVRLFPAMVRTMAHSRENARGGISSFQAFAIGLASRIGTGNIAGVAIAITLGGPGAVFWMWLIAVLGMATAFVEATLAQVFKMRWHDGTFRGGPAFYIWRGLRSRGWGAVFAVALLFAFGIVFEMAQANTMADTLAKSHGVPQWASALIIGLLVGVVILGGLRQVAKVAEIVAPVMALVYIVLALVVIVLNIDEIGFVFSEIFTSAFGLSEAFAGTAGGFTAAILNGVKRGLFSNEAGMGSAPNAASTATTDHPVRQGLIQSMGVFVDTMLVCSATAFIILTADASIYTPGASLEGASLTQSAVVSHLGGWIALPMTVLICVFAYSSIIGNYAYAEVNLDYLTGDRGHYDLYLRVAVIGAAMLGALLKIELVWGLADVAMGAMALVNLVAILLLGKWAIGALRDYEASGGAPFVAIDNPHLPGRLDTDIWTADNATGQGA